MKRKKKLDCIFCEAGIEDLTKKIPIKIPKSGKEEEKRKEGKVKEVEKKEEFPDCDREFYSKSKHWIVTLAPEQISIGQTLVILNKFAKIDKDGYVSKEDYEKHVEDMSDKGLTKEEKVDLFKTIRDVSNLLKKSLGTKKNPVERVYVCSLCDGAKHLHFHLIPRYKTDVKGFNFMGDREKLNRMGFKVGPEKNQDRIEWIKQIAKDLRNSK